MYTNEFKSCLKSVKIPAVVPCFVVVIRGCVVIGRWVDLCAVFLWWILGPCGVPGYPMFVFLAFYFRWTYVRCACVRSCVVFRLFCNDCALVSRVRLITWSECALFLLSPDCCCGLLRILPLCLYGSGVFVVFVMKKCYNY